MKKFIAVATIGAATVLTLAGCSGGGASPSPGGDKTLTIQDYYTETQDPIYQACAEEVGATLKINHVPGDGLIAKVLQQASSKTLPDVLMLDNPDVQQIAAAGALSPLSDYGLEPGDDVEAVVAAGTFDGKLYGIQPGVNSIALYYNVDQLAAAGLEPPTTWDELRSTAKALTNASTYGFAMSNINTYEGTWQFLPFLWSNGGDEADIDSPEVAEALQFILDLQDDGSLSASSITWGQGDVKDQFVAGNAAMMINGPWQIPGLEEVEGLNFGVVPIPVPHAGDTSIAPLGGEQFTVPNTGDEDKMALAGKFVGCLNTSDYQTKNAETTGLIPSSEAVATEWADANPVVAPFVPIVADAQARTGELGPDWPEAATKIYTAVQLVLTGSASPADAAAQAQAGN